MGKAAEIHNAKLDIERGLETLKRHKVDATEYLKALAAGESYTEQIANSQEGTRAEEDTADS